MPLLPSTTRATGSSAAYAVAFLKIVSFHDLRYTSFSMRFGRAAHLYAGANKRGRSVLTFVVEGEEGRKGSWGHANSALSDGLNVGSENAAVFV